MAEAPRQNESVTRGCRLRCWTKVASRIAGTPTARAEIRATVISRRGDISCTRVAKTSCARELAQARIMPATEASTVRKIAVVTVVNRNVSAADTSGPNAACEPSRYAVLPCGSACAITARPISAVAPNPTTVMMSTNSTTDDTAHDIERRT